MARIDTKRRGDRKDQTNLHIDRQDNPHNVTVEQLGLSGSDELYYTQDEISDIFNGDISVSGYNKSTWDLHVDNTSNPHNIDPSQIGAVPTTGGSFTGLTKHEAGINLPEMTSPNAPSSGGTLYVDSSDGDLKIIFANGTIKTIATN